MRSRIKKKTETTSRSLDFVRVCLVLMVSIIVMVFLIVYGALAEQSVYACSSDKDRLPVDVKIQCERLTKGQWWHK